MLINANYGHLIGKEIKAGKTCIELEMKWQRKSHEKAWFTFIGKASIDALREYFEKERGYPKPGEPIWFSNHGKNKPLTQVAYCLVWFRLLTSLGYRPKSSEGTWNRYGVSPHKIRTLAISQSQAAAGKTLKRNGRSFNQESAEYFAGHEIDELGYKQLHALDVDYRREQYLIVEKYLDPYERREFPQEQEIEELKIRLKEMESMKERLAKLEEMEDRLKRSLGLRE